MKEYEDHFSFVTGTICTSSQPSLAFSLMISLQLSKVSVFPDLRLPFGTTSINSYLNIYASICNILIIVYPVLLLKLLFLRTIWTWLHKIPPQNSRSFSFGMTLRASRESERSERRVILQTKVEAG